MLHKTKGLVLRSVKYGETSLVVTIYTELFGVQSYLVNGVRKSTATQPSRANLFQPPSLLDMVVYHNERNSLQRIKEYKWALVYGDLYRNVSKNSVALFMTEVLQKCLTQPEGHPDLFHFLEDVFDHLDRATPMVTVHFPLYFLVHLAHFFGFRLQDNYAETLPILDLQEGYFVEERPGHMQYLDGERSEVVSELLKTLHPDDLAHWNLSRELRRQLIETFIGFYQFHQSGFGTLKSLPVLYALHEG